MGRRHDTCTDGPPCIGRRRFLEACGATLASLGGLAQAAGPAGDAGGRRVRVALVFLSRAGSSWPHPEYDAVGREREILALLRSGCPTVAWTPVAVRTPGDVGKATALRDRVDGYLVYCVTLTWNLTGALAAIGGAGKPMIVADEFLGGSGLFLVGYSGLRRRGLPAAGVATTRPADLVAVARCFADLEPGTTPAAFCERCERVYRGTFPAPAPLRTRDDPVATNDIARCVARFRKARFLIVGRGKPGTEQDFLGARGIRLGFAELRAAVERVDPERARAWADRWAREAEAVVEPRPEVIRKAAATYLGVLDLLRRHGTDTITMDCLGGFARGELSAYPCLGFKQLLDEGAQGVCEAMPDDTLSMLMARILTGRPGYVSDPVLDTSKNRIVYAHCVATTKVFGPAGPSNRFRIRTLHNHDPRGACAQSFLPPGYMTTSFRTHAARKEMVIHQAKAAGNLDSARGCRTQLIGEVRGDIGKLFRTWDRFGWHRVTVYGDVRESLTAFGEALGLKVIEEA